MNNIFELLTEFATELDDKDLSKVADKVDSVTNSTLKIKTAQYIGAQGYWMRNRRCWENCYRIKRANKPDMPAQNVWFECHEEYLESINNDDSGWEKYAEEDKELKTSSSSSKVVKEAISKEKSFFNKKIEDKVNSGWDVGAAVFDTMNEGQSLERHREKFVDNANSLADVALELKKAGYEDLSKKAQSISSYFVKMAQFEQGSWLNPFNWGQRLKEKGQQFLGSAGQQDVINRLQRALQSTNALRTRLPQNLDRLTTEQDAMVQERFDELRNQVANELNVLEQMSRQNPEAGKLYQAIIGPFNQFANQGAQTGNITSRRVALDNLSAAIGQALGQEDQSSTTEMSVSNVPSQRPSQSNVGQSLGPELMSPEQQQQSREEFERTRQQNNITQEQPAVQQQQAPVGSPQEAANFFRDWANSPQKMGKKKRDMLSWVSNYLTNQGSQPQPSSLASNNNKTINKKANNEIYDSSSLSYVKKLLGK